MAIASVNGVRLFYEANGAGEIPLVLVHGSWGSHHNWDLVAARLAESFRVLTYDRRGHSESERLAGQGSVREDVADLAGLIQDLGLARIQTLDRETQLEMIRPWYRFGIEIGCFSRRRRPVPRS